MMGRVAIQRSLGKPRNSPPGISLNSKRVSLKSSEFRLQSGWGTAILRRTCWSQQVRLFSEMHGNRIGNGGHKSGRMLMENGCPFQLLAQSTQSSTCTVHKIVYMNYWLKQMVIYDFFFFLFNFVLLQKFYMPYMYTEK